MAGRAKFEVKGFREMARTLEQLGEEVSTKIGTDAVRASAQFGRDKVIEAAPFQPGSTVKSWRRKDGSVVTADYGHLKDNIRIKKERNLRKQHHIAYHVTVGRAFWGRFLEFGTKYMAARPFMRPAVDANIDGILGAMTDTLKKGIERAIKRQNRGTRK